MLLDTKTCNDIKNRLQEYDITRPRMDEIKFVQKIMDDYSVDRKTAIKMIQSVRRMSVLIKE